MGRELEVRKRRFYELVYIEREESQVFNYRDSLKLEE